MPITNVEELARLAGTSVASYATIANNEALADALSDGFGGAKMAPSQAAAFAARYRFLSQQPNVPLNGFSATVFQDTVTGRKVLAIRGTELPSDILNDVALTDALGIGAAGFANNQGVELYRYWKRLTTVPGQVVTYSDEEVAKLYVMANAAVSNLVQLLPAPGVAMVDYVRQQAGYSAFAAGVRGDLGADSGMPGQPVIQPGEQVDVTGHSLGGHLAMLFARLFPSSTREVVTLNAPTFFTWGDATLSRLGYPSVAGSNIARLEADGDGIHLLGNIDPGTVVGIAQENSPLPHAPFTANHSSATGTDAMNLLALFSRLDSARTGDAAGLSALMRSASSEYSRSFEDMLDGLRRMVYGSDVSATPVAVGGAHANRAAFYDNIAALSSRDAAGNYTNATFGVLAGKVRIEPTHDASIARTDFAALLSLNTGATFSLRLNDPSPASAATQALASRHSTTYTQWQADRGLTEEQRAAGQANFSDNYLRDRAAMLNTLVQANTLDRDVISVAGGGASTFYEDRTSSATVLAQAGAGTRIVHFGGAGTDTLEGGGLGDGLYGGAGNDTLNGLKGDDYLEGQTGNDSLLGGAGRDSLLGGVGEDTLEGGAEDDALYGGAGTDTYRFSGNWGTDTLVDAATDSVIDVTGIGRLTGDGAKLIAPDVWQTDDRRVTYYQVHADGGQQSYLLINVLSTDHYGNIRIAGWSPGQQGITFGTETATPQPDNVFDGDFIKRVNADGLEYQVNTATGNYFSDGVQANAQDAINGSSDADRIMGLGGNDGLSGGSGADTIDGGAGNDLILGGKGRDSLAGGEGDDVIYGSALGAIARPREVNFTTPSVPAGGVQRTRGFSWVSYTGQGARLVGNTATMLFTGVQGASTGVVWQEVPDGEYLISLAGDVIDGGAGNDYIAAGTGPDIVHGGADDDDIVGMHGADVLFGDEGADFIWGDGDSDPEMSARSFFYVPGPWQGDDVIDGGRRAANDNNFRNAA